MTAALDLCDVPAKNRLEAWEGEMLAGWLGYQLTDDLAVLMQTEVDRSFEGRGVGGTLARRALDDARSRGLKVLIVCPFVLQWIGRHREYADLLHNAKPTTVTD